MEDIQIPKFEGIEAEEENSNIVESKEANRLALLKSSILRREKEGIIDKPISFKIGNKLYPYTSRTIGHAELIYEELVNLFSEIDAISIIFKDKEFINSLIDEESDKNTTVEKVVAKFLRLHGKNGFNAIIRVSQILLEPIDQNNLCAPNLEKSFLTYEEAKWGLDIPMFAKIISEFIRRDAVPFGDSIKKAMSLNQ